MQSPSLAVACVVLLACAATQRGRDPISEPVRAQATVSFNVARRSDIFALRQILPLEWSHVSWIPVPDAENFRLTAYTLREVTETPALLLVHRKPGAPHFSISTIGVNSGPPRAATRLAAVAQDDAIPSWCTLDSWMAAFFLDGVGAPPREPVVVEYRTGASEHRMIVDPARSTIRGAAALSVVEEAMPPGQRTHEASISVAVSKAAPAALPLIVARSGERIFANAGPHRHSLHWFVTLNSVEEWLVYFLVPLPEMPDSETLGCSSRL